MDMTQVQYLCLEKCAFGGVGSRLQARRAQLSRLRAPVRRMRSWYVRDEPGGSCELSCNPSVCCNEPAGCQSLAAPRLQQPAVSSSQPRCGGSRSPGQRQGTACSHGGGGSTTPPAAELR